MPTVLRIGPYLFFFYSLENDEPAHIHVEAGAATAEFWLGSPSHRREAFARTTCRACVLR